MKYYRCYLLTPDDHIDSAMILRCADDDDAKRQCRQIVATNGGFPAAEVWDGARRVFRYPEDQATPDAFTGQIAADRQRRLEAEAVKAVGNSAERVGEHLERS